MNAASDFIQSDRILRIETSLGADVLLAERMTWREEISGLFEGRITVRSKLDDLTPDQLLGKPVDVSLELGEGERRYFNGIVTDLIAGPRQTRGLWSYELILRPQLWLLSQTSDCRIWMNKSALDIADDLLSEHGIPSMNTAGMAHEPPPRQHFSSQWNEDDLSYLLRRFQEDGLFFFWVHEKGAHKMHVGSHVAGYVGKEDVRFAHGSSDRNHINRFETRFRYIPGSHAGRDWNFETPSGVPEGTTPGLVNLPRNGNYERFEYPVQAGYGTGARASEGIERSEIERVSKLRMLAMEAEHARIDGASDVRTLASGHRFTPYDVADPSNTFDQHVILALEFEATDPTYETGGGRPEYSNRFLAIPADVPATPQRTVPQPRIEGAQVAIVAGPEGEEIHTDEYGRIKLWFPWDRRAKKDGSDTCWVRVTQNWAGRGWGGQVIPRIGMEVMVTYLDGDPDRPVVTGVVPNKKRKVPYELPEHKTRSTFRTDTHKGTGFNELRFEDQAGREEVFIQAERDRVLYTKVNAFEHIGLSERRAVGYNRHTDIGNNENRIIGGDLQLSVGSSASALSAISQSLAFSNLKSSGVTFPISTVRAMGDALAQPVVGKGNMRVSISGNCVPSVGKNDMTQIKGARNVIVDGLQSEIINGDDETFVSGNRIETTRGQTVLTADKKFTVECGDSRIVLNPSGTIEIIGHKILINGKDTIVGKAKRIDLN